MKTRNQIYNGEGEKLLRIITTYHALYYEQVMQIFQKDSDSMKAFITSLVKQGRLYYDPDSGLLCDSAESAASPDPGTLAAFWVLLDFKKAVIYHNSGEFPVKLTFFARDEMYEVIYIGIGQEALISHALRLQKESGACRLVILESESQAKNLPIDGVAAFCIVGPGGAVSYYRKGGQA